MSSARNKTLAISGGVGGAKLALGLNDSLPSQQLHILVNTADDFLHWGLHISPDIDTLLYTLAGIADPAQGWGVVNESFAALDAVAALGGEDWFRLGDKDLATHLLRTQALATGQGLAAVTADLSQRLALESRVHPMTDDAVRTMVRCGDRELPFQHYFVRERCEPAVSGFRFDGIDEAQPNAEVMQLLAQAAFGRIVICPSNPYVSIDPVLQLPGLWQQFRDSNAAVTLVSPIVAGMAIKGPAAKMMQELGVPVTALGVAEHYARHYPGLVDNFVIDTSDGTLATAIEQLGMQVVITSTVMRSRQDKQALAQVILELGHA